jgi:hypothetical protein
MKATQGQIEDVEKIARAERDSLRMCEAIIERGLRSFCEVAAALLMIRDERLYRAAYGTFDEYCRKRWNWGRNYVDKQIQAAEVVNHLSTQVLTPQTEKQVRPLAALSPQDRSVAWGQAVEESDGGQPTAAKVDEVAKTVKQVEALRKKLGANALDPVSLRELQEVRRRIIANSDRMTLLFRCVEAIETLSRPPMNMQDLARKILDMDTPDRDWRGHASRAQQNLTQLVKEMK